MACSDTKPKRKLKSTALKKLNDILEGFVDSLVEENAFNIVLNVVVNRDRKRELVNRLKIVRNLVTGIIEQVPHIQENLTLCDEILSFSASQEDVMYAPKTGSDVCGDGAGNANAKSRAKNRRRARRQANTCRHYCNHHPEVMDTTLWRNLPREVVQHICSFLPLSKTLKLQKLCKPWSWMPMAANFRQSCAKAHDDLFGILISDDSSESYRIAVSNSKHNEWINLELKVIPDGRFGWNGRDKELFAHDGGLVCILPSDFRCFEESQEPPSIFVFNPLTGDRRDIPLSSFFSENTLDTEAVLLQLIVDSKTGCYELILVTQIGISDSGAEVYCSEKYDSKSKLWSTMDSGFVFGDGVLGNERREVYFDCCSKELWSYDGETFEDEIGGNSESVTFVKDHRFEIGYVDNYGEYRDSRSLEMVESVWENGWITQPTLSFRMEEPPSGLRTRLFACQRYLLVVADDAPSDVFEHRHQRMLLFDRKTCIAAYDIPDFWKEDDVDDGDAETFLDRKVHVMCDLKWDVVP